MPNSEYLTPSQAADLLKVAPSTLSNWRVRREGPPYKKLGRGRNAKVLYTRQDIEAWMGNMTQPQLGKQRRKP